MHVGGRAWLAAALCVSAALGARASWVPGSASSVEVVFDRPQRPDAIAGTCGRIAAAGDQGAAGTCRATWTSERSVRLDGAAPGFVRRRGAGWELEVRGAYSGAGRQAIGAPDARADGLPDVDCPVALTVPSSPAGQIHIGLAGGPGPYSRASIALKGPGGSHSLDTPAWDGVVAVPLGAILKAAGNSSGWRAVRISLDLERADGRGSVRVSRSVAVASGASYGSVRVRVDTESGRDARLALVAEGSADVRDADWQAPGAARSHDGSAVLRAPLPSSLGVSFVLGAHGRLSVDYALPSYASASNSPASVYALAGVCTARASPAGRLDGHCAGFGRGVLLRWLAEGASGGATPLSAPSAAPWLFAAPAPGPGVAVEACAAPDDCVRVEAVWVAADGASLVPSSSPPVIPTPPPVIQTPPPGTSNQPSLNVKPAFPHRPPNQLQPVAQSQGMNSPVAIQSGTGTASPTQQGSRSQPLSQSPAQSSGQTQSQSQRDGHSSAPQGSQGHTADSQTPASGHADSKPDGNATGSTDTQQPRNATGGTQGDRGEYARVLGQAAAALYARKSGVGAQAARDAASGVIAPESAAALAAMHQRLAVNWALGHPPSDVFSMAADGQRARIGVLAPGSKTANAARSPPSDEVSLCESAGNVLLKRADAGADRTPVGRTPGAPYACVMAAPKTDATGSAVPMSVLSVQLGLEAPPPNGSAAKRAAARQKDSSAPQAKMVVGSMDSVRFLKDRATAAPEVAQILVTFAIARSKGLLAMGSSPPPPACVRLSPAGWTADGCTLIGLVEDAPDPDTEAIRCACLEAVTLPRAVSAGAPKGRATAPGAAKDAFAAHADAPSVAFASLVYGLDSAGVYRNANADDFDALGKRKRTAASRRGLWVGLGVTALVLVLLALAGAALYALYRKRRLHSLRPFWRRKKDAPFRTKGGEPYHLRAFSSPGTRSHASFASRNSTTRNNTGLPAAPSNAYSRSGALPTLSALDACPESPAKRPALYARTSALAASRPDDASTIAEDSDASECASVVTLVADGQAGVPRSLSGATLAHAGSTQPLPAPAVPHRALWTRQDEEAQRLERIRRILA